MIRLANICFFILCVTTLYSQKNKISREEYINAYSKIAMEEMQRSGVPASITLAQGCLESSNGNSRLAIKGRNHFGIKCHNTWKGKKIYKDDDAKHECFRVYKTVSESYIDHSNFLRNGTRYAFLFDLKPTDYKGWAKGLKKAGYATNPKYPSLLIKIIEDNKLYEYDEIALGKRKDSRKTKQENILADVEPKKDVKPVKRQLVKDEIAELTPPLLFDELEFSIDAPGRKVLSNNKVNYIIVQPGDTFYGIAREFGLSEWQLFLFNDLEKTHILRVGEVLYLQTKKNRAQKKYPYHVIRKGEDLHLVSQLYAVKLKKIKKINGFSSDPVLNEGDKVKLRK